MKRCSLFCAGLWPFLLFPLLLLLLFALFQWRSVEQDVVINAQDTINQTAQSWAKAEIYNRGREVLITGLAPSEEAQSELRKTVLSVKGVNSVTFADGIAEPIPLRSPTLTVNWLDGKVVLNGELNSQSNIDDLLQEANNTYGPTNVLNQLQLSDLVSDISPTQGLLSKLTGLKNGAQLFLENNKVVVTGEVESLQIKTDIGNQLKNTFNGTVENLLSVVPAVKVNLNEKCESRLNEILATTKIVFATGKATISAESKTVLDNIASVINECPDADFEVAGHTDSTGNLNFNMRLSKERSQAVVDRLTESGFARERFDVQGYGPHRPIADNTSNEGRAKNRRIEFNLKN